MTATPNAQPLQALIFDVDGTLADTEDAHRAAFNHAFAQAGLGWTWDEVLYTKLLDVTGGKERIRHYHQQLTDASQGRTPDQAATADRAGTTEVADLVERVHALKTAAYVALVQRGAVQLRAGVVRLLQTASSQGLQLAIATTTTRANIDALLQAAIGPDWASYFAVIEDATTAPSKKPHPQAYQQALQRLGLPAGACLAFEDSSNGLEAARRAGLATVVTPNRYTQHHSFEGALRRLPSLQWVTVADLQAWHAGSKETA
jgi:HAD superfamily hydrolase (TIGR01509 family)